MLLGRACLFGSVMFYVVWGVIVALFMRAAGHHCASSRCGCVFNAAACGIGGGSYSRVHRSYILLYLEFVRSKTHGTHIPPPGRAAATAVAE